ncbi:hypothetical protein A4S02_08735 [Acetobacter ascendens]|uniref:Uncharacterized protein n=1 Tax=Acetobacter ascendens TaxID=481146 RepID=A0A1D8QZT6_9PROT|nr:hypothetical protein A4S02_08735 [Acetobacter ascendens]AOW50451.1 hypothetical protein A4R89_06530 [Acetobacter ascendens]
MLRMPQPKNHTPNTDQATHRTAKSQTRANLGSGAGITAFLGFIGFIASPRASLRSLLEDAKDHYRRKK